jgi:putative ABC transport system permease protein
MPVLAKKLLRTIGSTFGQFAASAVVVAVGIVAFVSMTAVSDNLIRSRDAFYRETDFAEHFFHVVKAPEGVLARVEAVEGVLRATVRLQKDVPVLRDDGMRTSLRLTGYPLPEERELSRIRVMEGRLFEKYPEGGAVEILLDPLFAKAHGLGQGDTVPVGAEGRRKVLTVTGTAAGPEFVYAVKGAGSLLEDPSSFGIAVIPQNQLQQLLEMKGYINQVLIRFTPGTDTARVVREIEKILEPYGNLTNYPRKDQISEAILRGELNQLKAFARFIPSIFLGVAVLMQFVFIGRMVQVQRGQIGVLKATGYGNGSLLALYGGYALAATGCGAAAGTLLGYILAQLLTRVYSAFFNLPRLEEALHFRTAWVVLSATLVVGTLAGVWSARGVLSIRPAESMRPVAPKSVRPMFFEKIPLFSTRLSLPWRMSFRSMGRNRFRAAVTTLGVLFAVGMLVVSVFSRDSMDNLMVRHFEKEWRFDYMIRTLNPVREADLLGIANLPGVEVAEPFFELPVRLHFRGSSREDLLFAMHPGSELGRVTALEGHELDFPEEGFYLDWYSARILGASTGDDIEVETILGLGPPRRSTLRVAGISRKAFGSASGTSLAIANRLLGEQSAATGIVLDVVPEATEALETRLGNMINVVSVISRQKEVEYLEKNMKYLYYSVGIMVIFSVILGFAIVFNASSLSFSERKRELASLRILGFTIGEVSSLLWKENLLLLCAGTILGLPFGKMLAEAYAVGVSTDLFTFEAVIYPLTYALAALGGGLFILIAYWLAVRGVQRLEPVETLKAND